MFENQIKEIMKDQHIEKLKREQYLKELTKYIENISEFEQNHIYLKELIRKSKKRHKKAIDLMIKGKIHRTRVNWING